MLMAAIVFPVAVPIIIRLLTTSNGKLTVADVTAANAPYNMLFWAGISELPVICKNNMRNQFLKSSQWISRNHQVTFENKEGPKSRRKSLLAQGYSVRADILAMTMMRRQNIKHSAVDNVMSSSWSSCTPRYIWQQSLQRTRQSLKRGRSCSYPFVAPLQSIVHPKPDRSIRDHTNKRRIQSLQYISKINICIPRPLWCTPKHANTLERYGKDFVSDLRTKFEALHDWSRVGFSHENKRWTL